VDGRTEEKHKNLKRGGIDISTWDFQNETQSRQIIWGFKHCSGQNLQFSI
jgi:hypothetical protein